MYITDEKFPEIILEAVKDVDLANQVTNTIRREDNTELGYIIKNDNDKVLEVYPIREIDIGQFYVAAELAGFEDYSVVFKDGKELYVTDPVTKTESNADLQTMIALKMVKLANRFDTIKIRPRVPVLNNKFYLDGSKDDLNNFEVYRDLLVLNSQYSGTIKDADGKMQNVTLDELEKCINEIKRFGLNLYQLKWKKEAEIMNCTTKEDVKAIDIKLI